MVRVADEGEAPPRRRAAGTRDRIGRRRQSGVLAVEAVVHAHGGDPVVARVQLAERVERREEAEATANDGVGLGRQLDRVLVVPPAVAAELHVASAHPSEPFGEIVAPGKLEGCLCRVCCLQIVRRVGGMGRGHSLRLRRGERGNLELERERQKRDVHRRDPSLKRNDPRSAALVNRGGRLSPEEVQQHRELDRGGHHAEDHRRTDIAPGLVLIFLRWGVRSIHSQC